MLPAWPRRVDEIRFRRDLAQRIRSARVATWGPKQSACAAALRIHQSQLSRWESGETMPRITELLRIAAACGTTLDELTRGHVQTAGTQLLLGLDADAQAAVVDLVDIIRKKTREAARQHTRGARRRSGRSVS